jgi:hypothetical protein
MIVEQVPDARVARDLGGLHRGRVVVEDVVCDLHEAGPARALSALVQQAHELRVVFVSPLSTTERPRKSKR